jgi:hypothetical protein
MTAQPLWKIVEAQSKANFRRFGPNFFMNGRLSFDIVEVRVINFLQSGHAL